MPTPIEGQGTDETTWRAWRGLAIAPILDPTTLLEGNTRALIVSPHPDDEVLALGGTIAHLAQRGHPIVIVSVSDGEACYPDSRFWTPDRLAHTRSQELRQALSVLGTSIEIVRLKIPDGELARNEDGLAAALVAILRAGDMVFSTWRGDGHPDHEAAGRSCARACFQLGLRHIELPVWTWHWATPADPNVPWDRLVRIPLNALCQQSKHAAVRFFKSQLLVPEGDLFQPILPSWVLERFSRPYESVFV